MRAIMITAPGVENNLSMVEALDLPLDRAKC